MTGRPHDMPIRRRKACAGAVLCAVLALPWFAAASLAHVDPWPGDARPSLRVGSMTLRHCRNVPAYCGQLDRPIDPTQAVLGGISIHFEYYPHSAPGSSAGTLVATEGGPGYPATLSRDEYLELFKPLRRTHDVLLMDNRGTG